MAVVEAEVHMIELKNIANSRSIVLRLIRNI